VAVISAVGSTINKSFSTTTTQSLPARAVRNCWVEVFAAPSLRHAQAFLAPQPLDLLVVDRPAVGTSLGAGVAKPRRGWSARPARSQAHRHILRLNRERASG
jgi:hypothetical protein